MLYHRGFSTFGISKAFFLVLLAVVQEIGGLSIGKSAVRFLTILHVEVLGKLLNPELPSMQPLKL